MKAIILGLLSLSMVSCYQTRQGRLDVYESFTLKAKGNKKVTIDAGNYTAKLKLKTKKKFQLLIPEMDYKFVFKVPKGIKLPQNHGNVKLSSRALKQPIDIDLTADKRVLESEVYTVTERCSETVYRRVCRTERTPARRVCRNYPDGSRRCTTHPPRTRRVCRNEPRNVYGDRRVTYRDITEEKIFLATIFAPGTSDVVGEFDSTKRTKRRNMISSGPCRIDRRTYPPVVTTTRRR